MSQSLLRSLTVSLVVALGIGFAASLAYAFAAVFVARTVQRGEGFALVEVTYDGEPVVVRMVADASGRYVHQEVVNLAGQSVQADTQRLLRPGVLASLQPQLAAADSWLWRLAAVTDGGSPPTYWYLVHDGRTNGQAYGVGFHSQTRAVVGYFGKQGFADHLPPRDQWFEFAGNSGLAGPASSIVRTEPYWADATTLYFVAGGKLWVVDPAKRMVRELADIAGTAAIGSAYIIPVTGPATERGALGEAPNPRLFPQLLMLHEGERITLADPNTGAKRTYSLPPSLRRKMIGGFALPGENLLLVSSDRAMVRSMATVPKQEITWINLAGEVIRSEEVRLPPGGVGDPGIIAWSGMAAISLPLTCLVVGGWIPNQMLFSGQTDSYAEAVWITLGLLWPSIVVLIAIGCVTATLAYRRQRRFGLPGATAWAVFAFVLGIPGWIAYRFHRSWPVLEECPACHQAAPRDRDACTECGADFPPPALKGIEVFA